MGFIGYRQQREGNSGEVVRIYLECREDAAGRGGTRQGVSFSSAVDVNFPGGGAPCILRGVEGVLVLKKFYKLVFSLEERAREHGSDWRSVMESPAALLEHLRFTRNARDFTGQPEPVRAMRADEIAEPHCVRSGP